MDPLEFVDSFTFLLSANKKASSHVSSSGTRVCNLNSDWGAFPLWPLGFHPCISEGEMMSGDEETSDSHSSDDGLEDGVCDCCGSAGRVVVEHGETLAPGWWDTRFLRDIEQGTVSEWVVDYACIAHFLLPHLDSSARTLVVGCGNSDFSGLLCTDGGFLDVVNTDISPVVIDHMQAKHAEHSALTWVVDDCCNMSFEASSFEQIVDKSLLDCMCYCVDPEFQGCVADFLGECFRVLVQGGVAIFATKQNEAALEEIFPCAGPLANRWCDLDWTISRQEIYVPRPTRDGETVISSSARAVADKGLLPQGCDSFDTIFIFKAVKWRQPEGEKQLRRSEPGG